MNRRSILAVIFIFSLLFAFQAFAADTGSSGSSSAPDSGMSSGTSGGAATSGSISQMDKSSLMGKNVESSDGKKIGKVSDVVTDPSTNTIAYAIVSYQGKNYPVPANALSSKDDRLALNIDKDKFASAPTLAAGQKPDINDQAMNSQVHQFYGVSPSWSAGVPGGMAPAAPGGAAPGGGPSGGGTSGGGGGY